MVGSPQIKKSETWLDYTRKVQLPWITAQGLDSPGVLGLLGSRFPSGLARARGNCPDNFSRNLSSLILDIWRHEGDCNYRRNDEIPIGPAMHPEK